MKVLVADYNLYSNIGGGQTSYRTLISNNPQTEFYYFDNHEAVQKNLPANVRTIPYQHVYKYKSRLGDLPISEQYESIAATQAANLALSAQGLEFDVIDVPDYKDYVPFLRPAFEHHGVKFSRLALALHGLISTSTKLNWPGKTFPVETLKVLNKFENISYKSTDIRYGLSKRYIQERKAVSDALPSQYFSPFFFFSPFPLLEDFERNNHKVDLTFVGRQERLKGPDIFLDLAWHIDSKLYEHVQIVGPLSHSWDGVSSQKFLTVYAENRLPNTRFVSCRANSGLLEVFRNRGVIFLPSRYDSFNLLALESLLSGCPTVIGDGAGVCDFLKSDFQEIPFIELKIDQPEASIPAIEDLLINYNARRETLINTIKKIDLKSLIAAAKNQYGLKILNSEAKYDLETIHWCAKKYHAILKSPVCYINQKWKTSLPADLWAFYRKRRLELLNNLPSKITKKLLLFTQKIWRKICKFGIRQLKHRIFDNNSAFPFQLLRLRHLSQAYAQCNTLHENNSNQIIEKIGKYWDLNSTFQLGKIRSYTELGRLEIKLGHVMNSCAYQLRRFRLLGSASQHELDLLVSHLKDAKLELEAEVAKILYHPGPREQDFSFLDKSQTRVSDLLIFDYLEKRRKSLLSQESVNFEIFDDCRDPQQTYLVSIVVSLYNAEKKLPLFIDKIKKQTLFSTNKLEIIFVDSNSPSQEYRVFQQLVKSLNLPSLYIRTFNRETIQTAWNRAIPLCRGKYLSFLGVDETLKLDACEILLNELLRDDSIDWVMSNSLVTEVDMEGNWIGDVMTYDRTDYHPHIHYLECAYLSYVGGMYKKDLHTRFGYYDGSFRAAGDTEFKNRVLPFIKTKAISQVLGKFLNYPDERTTASALAELEDLRAWYLHRSKGGIRYAFQFFKSSDELEALFWKALSYRKSYLKSTSTDVEFAINLLEIILERDPHHSLKTNLNDLRKVLKIFRNYDLLPARNAFLTVLLSLKNLVALKLIEKRLNRKIPSRNIRFNVVNDNRYEQHHWNWKF